MTAMSFLGRMFVVNIVLAVSGMLACLCLSGHAMAVAAGVAGLAGALNLLLLGLLVLRLLTPGTRRMAVVALLIVKLAVLAAAIVVVSLVFDMDPIGLAVGFSSTVAAVLISSAVVGLSGRDIVM